MGSRETTGTLLASIPRTCTHCKHTYTFNCRLGHIHQGRHGGEQAVRTSLNDQVRQLTNSVYCQSTYGVVCPACGRMASSARGQHFPSGFRQGLQDSNQALSVRLSRGHRVSRIILLPLLALALCILCIVPMLNLDIESRQVLLILSAGGTLVFLAAWVLAEWIAGSNRATFNKLEQLLQQASEEDAGAIIRAAHNRNWSLPSADPTEWRQSWRKLAVNVLQTPPDRRQALLSAYVEGTRWTRLLESSLTARPHIKPVRV